MNRDQSGEPLCRPFLAYCGVRLRHPSHRTHAYQNLTVASVAVPLVGTDTSRRVIS